MKLSWEELRKARKRRGLGRGCRNWLCVVDGNGDFGSKLAQRKGGIEAGVQTGESEMTEGNWRSRAHAWLRECERGREGYDLLRIRGWSGVHRWCHITITHSVNSVHLHNGQVNSPALPRTCASLKAKYMRLRALAFKINSFRRFHIGNYHCQTRTTFTSAYPRALWNSAEISWQFRLAFR